MGEFRLEGGSHAEGSGEDLKKFKRGDIVESDDNLVEKFKGKFKEIVDAVPVSKSVVKPGPKSKETKTT